MHFLGKIGDIFVEAKQDSEELSVEWEIRNFFRLSGQCGDYYHSPDFYFSNASWCLEMFPNGDTRNPQSGYVGLFLRRKDEGPPLTIQFTLGIEGADGKEIKGETKHEFSKNASGCGWHKFLSRQVLKDCESILMPDNIMILSCRIKSVGPSPTRGISSYNDTPNQTNGAFEESSTRTSGNQLLNKQDASVQTDEEFKEAQASTKENCSSGKQGIEKAVEDLGKLLVSCENSDVTVQVGDTEFRVHRAILSARCPVLSAMFQHQTAEKASSKIIVKDCEPDVFKDFLQYLYTGSVQSLTQENVFGLYRIADQYLADDLKLQCLVHIQETLSVQTFCETVKLALTHDESGLLKLAIDFAIKNIQSIVCSVEWQLFICGYPREANEILIKCLVPQSSK